MRPILSLLIRLSPMLLLLLAGPGRADVERVRLEDLLRRVDAGPAGEMARAAVHRYQAMASRAFWSFLHDLNLTTAFGYAPTCDPRSDNPGLCQEEVDALDWTSYRPTLDVRVEGTLLLYTFGKRSSAMDQARAGVAAARHQGDAKLAELRTTIKQAYWGAILGRELLDMVIDVRTRLERELAKRQGGGASWEDEEDEDDEDDEDRGELDRDTVEIGSYLAEAKVLEAKARAGLGKALEALRIVAGRPPGTRVAPVQERLEPLVDGLPPEPEVVEAALAHNPELLAAKAGVDAARAGLARAEADLWPSLVLRGGARLNITAGADCLVDPSQPAVCRDSKTGYPYAFLAVKWNLEYTELITKYQEAKAKLREMIAQYDGARLLVETDVRAAYRDAREKLDILAARREAERWARRKRSMAAAGCGGMDLMGDQAGGCDERALAKAMRAYLEAKAARLQAVYDLDMALDRLEATVGAPSSIVTSQAGR